MRILAITNCYPRPAQPTKAMFNALNLRALAKLHEIRTIVPVAWTERLGDQVPTPAEIQSDGMRVYYPAFWFTPKVLQSHYGRFFLQSIRRTVERIRKDFSPDAILAFWADPDGWAAVKIARELGIPVLIRVIGSDVLILGRNRRRRGRIADALRQADGVLAVSRDLAEHVRRLGVESAKIHVVSEGTDTEMFCPGDQAAARIKLNLPAAGRMLLFVGNLLFSKGAGLVIQACGALRDQGIDFTCYLVGGGNDETRLRKLASKLNLENRVVFAGRFLQKHLPDWYRAADLVTLPSYSEGIPNVLRETMCCGTPFVATRVGGIPEITPPGLSRLVDAGDLPQLVAALREMLAGSSRIDPAISSSHVISWEQSAAMFDRLLREAVAAGNPKSATDKMMIPPMASAGRAQSSFPSPEISR